MKLRRLFLLATLVGTLAVIGCGDDETTATGGTSGTGGTGGTNGGGDVCNTGSCVDNATLRQACETAVGVCNATPGLDGALLQACIDAAVLDACSE